MDDGGGTTTSLQCLTCHQLRLTMPVGVAERCTSALSAKLVFPHSWKDSPTWISEPDAWLREQKSVGRGT